jgi:uncharacterized protein YaiI (UPF0178 family)
MDEAHGPALRVWVDADACPVAVRDILCRAAERRGFALLLVANQALRVPRSRFVRAIQVASGFDEADARIVRDAAPGDIVITSDIPLAAQVIRKAGRVLTPRGERLTEDNISQRLSVRNLMDELRGSGVRTGGPPGFTARDRHAFASEFERMLSS